MQIPKNFKLQYSAAEIQAVNHKLGSKISNWIKSLELPTNQQVVVVPILRGSIFFFADLVRAIDCSVSISPVRCWSYNAEDNSQREEVKVDSMGFDVKDQVILLIDDICDSGRTLHHISNNFIAAGARQVSSAVLVNRHLQEPLFKPDFIGFNFDGPEWFVGYGMNHEDFYRNLSDIYIIK